MKGKNRKSEARERKEEKEKKDKKTCIFAPSPIRLRMDSKFSDIYMRI
jgi:hypothetical protein